MTTPITVSIPHQLGRVEARRRIEAGFANVTRQLPVAGAVCSQRWDGDRLAFSVVLLGQTVSGALDVLDTAVAIRIELPGVLGMLAGSFGRRLQNATQLLLTKKD
jgi:hypothetical protein